jgi:hypothetical protein
MLNQKQTSTTQLYPYKAWLENLFCYNVETKLTRLPQQLWYQDDVGTIDSCSADNIGWLSRFHYATKSKTLSMLGKLSADFFKQRRLIPNGTSMDIKLTPLIPTFSLMSEDEGSFKVKITDATLI